MGGSPIQTVLVFESVGCCKIYTVLTNIKSNQKIIQSIKKLKDTRQKKAIKYFYRN